MIVTSKLKINLKIKTLYQTNQIVVYAFINVQLLVTQLKYAARGTQNESWNHSKNIYKKLF
jgi:hypothetical protein